MRQSVIVLSLLFAASAAAQVQVVVQIYNNANLSHSILAKTTASADRAFAGASITLRWQSCEPRCEEDSDIPTFIMGVAGPQLAIPARAVLGFAMLAAGNGNRAVVSVPRIEDFAESTATPLPVALGHAIAHELGHLIARSNGHTVGIMAARWDNFGAARMRQGTLRFSQSDIGKMHKRLKASASLASQPAL